MQKLENIFKQNMDLSEVKTYPKYRLIEAGNIVEIQVLGGKFVYLGTHHLSEEGVLCDDLETFVKWDMFS